MRADGPEELWERLRTWATRWRLPAPSLSEGWRDLPPSYRPLAVDGQVTRPLFEPPGDGAHRRALETRTGITLPEQLTALYAVHGGSYAPLLPFGMPLLPYEAILTRWQSEAALADEYYRTEPEPGFVSAGTHHEAPFHRSWLPVADNDVGALMLDFGPGPEGTRGQVLFPVDEVEFVVVAPSLPDFLRTWLTALDDGRAWLSPDHGYPVPRDVDGDYLHLFVVDPS